MSRRGVFTFKFCLMGVLLATPNVSALEVFLPTSNVSLVGVLLSTPNVSALEVFLPTSNVSLVGALLSTPNVSALEVFLPTSNVSLMGVFYRPRTYQYWRFSIDLERFSIGGFLSTSNVSLPYSPFHFISSISVFNIWSILAVFHKKFFVFIWHCKV